MSQAGMLEQMRVELHNEGHDVVMIGINKPDAVANQQALLDKCSFPILQDLDAVQAWGLLGGQKDDYLIYTADGKLFDYLPISGDRPTNLSMNGGYQTVKQAILDAIAKGP